MAITAAGERAVVPVPPLNGNAHRDCWLSHRSLRGASRAILGALFHRPNGADAARPCSHTRYEYSGDSGTRSAPLRRAGVIEGGNGEVMRSSAVLLEA
jgi:hypothetical protein